MKAFGKNKIDMGRARCQAVVAAQTHWQVAAGTGSSLVPLRFCLRLLPPLLATLFCMSGRQRQGDKEHTH